MKHANELLYPRLADLPGLVKERRVYATCGYLLLIPAADASDEEKIAFAEAMAEPWDSAKCNRSLDLTARAPDDVRGRNHIMYVPIRCAGDWADQPWTKWDAPAETVGEWDALKAAGTVGQL